MSPLARYGQRDGKGRLDCRPLACDFEWWNTIQVYTSLTSKQEAIVLPLILRQCGIFLLFNKPFEAMERLCCSQTGHFEAMIQLCSFYINHFAAMKLLCRILIIHFEAIEPIVSLLKSEDRYWSRWIGQSKLCPPLPSLWPLYSVM